MKSWKIAALSALATLGLAAATSAAQRANQPSPAPPQQPQTMDRAKPMDHNQMMNDPEMRRQMTEMMSNCNRMMERMGNMPQMKGQ